VWTKIVLEFYIQFEYIVYIQINTWAFPYWPGYHPETPILARDGVNSIQFFALLYADDIILLSSTQEGLQNVCSSWKLDVNQEKSKAIVNKVKYNNYFITINHVCHRFEQREVIQARLS
jgi:hypothetical protein